jgi:aromatic-L-amino-acid decarboxylase
MVDLGHAILDRAIDFVDGLPDRPACGVIGDPAAGAALVRELLEPPPETPTELSTVIDRLERAAAYAFETAGPGYFAYIPGGGLYASAVTDVYTAVTNRYVGLAAPAPALAAMEHSVVRWFARVCGLPEGSGGVLLSGGSLANLTAVVAARHAGLGEQIADGTLYLTAHTHQSIAKAARLAGLPAASVRIVPCTADLRMDVEAAARLVAADRAAGKRPFLLVGSAGTTNTGAIDPLPALATLARREGLWFHVDGAYGGLFRLTERGRQRLAGVEEADSVTLDPHKTLFLPYGIGALVVRDPDRLADAHATGGHYLQDLTAEAELPDYGHLGPELSREARGPRIWLPLHLYGVGTFRDALDEKLDLAQTVYKGLSAEPRLEVPWVPGLSTVAFRVRPAGSGEAAVREADVLSRRLLALVNASGRIYLSSTDIDGRYTLRVCVVVHRTHADRTAEAIDIITRAVRRL